MSRAPGKNDSRRREFESEDFRRRRDSDCSNRHERSERRSSQHSSYRHDEGGRGDSGPRERARRDQRTRSRSNENRRVSRREQDDIREERNPKTKSETVWFPGKAKGESELELLLKSIKKEESKMHHVKRESQVESQRDKGGPVSSQVQDATATLQPEETENEEAPRSPEKPNFEPSGLLLQETNMKNGVILKYTEPQDARMPVEKWRIYMFKGDDTQELKTLYLHRESSFLIGKEPRVAEIFLCHPTISKQHAAIQFRYRFGKICPYLIDLESTNGSYLNGEKIEPLRYVELRHGDSMKFGKSTRDLVLILEDEAEPVETDSYANYADRAIDDIKKRVEAGKLKDEESLL